MIAYWLYNMIKSSANKENSYMNLDVVLDQIGCTADTICLKNNHPESVSISDNNSFYIKPSLKDISTSKDSKLLLFSAPGATGKSALAHYISGTCHALLWDLSKEKIANHSFSGMLVESLGTETFSQFTEGLKNGTAVLVIDALDESEMISGRFAVETLLSDLRKICIDAVKPDVILCARTETAHSIKEYYAQEENKLAISQYEISFFEESSAVDFIKQKIATNGKTTPVTDDWIKSQFAVIKNVLENDPNTIRSFIGYAPVLEALHVFFEEEPNTMALLQKTERQSNSTDVFCKIIDHILTREQSKVVNGFKERCIQDFPDFDNWESVYTAEEQLIRIANLLIFGEAAYDRPLSLPQELAIEYNELVNSFLPNHPFIQVRESDDSIEKEFTGAAFRDYTLARLMTTPGYDEYAIEYFSIHHSSFRCPSLLFFDFYAHFSEGKTVSSHFSYLYDSYKAKEQAGTLSEISIEEVDDSLYFTFKSQILKKHSPLSRVELQAPLDGKPIPIIQLNNAYVDINSDISLGRDGEDVSIDNSTIKCRKILLKSPHIMITAQKEEGCLISAPEGIHISSQLNPKFDLRVPNKSLLKISVSNINDWYKLHDYMYDLQDESTIDLPKFENAVKTILKHFRKHGKDAPGRHYEFIQNVIVGGSDLKQSILEFFLDKKIFYQDVKDPRQYKLDTSKLETYGVNWGLLAQNSTPMFSALFSEFTLWQNAH